MKRTIISVLLLVSLIGLFAQNLSVSVTGTINTDCIGRGCFYNGATILINEVMLSPSSYDGSMIGSSYHTTGGGEWIELYNPHKCDSVDISCYYLGNNAYDNTYLYGNWPGGFVIPPGTVVPPQGFAMIRGYRTAAVPSSMLVQNGGNVVEVVINSRSCFGSGGGRLWFPNAGGWFAFYDANGVPQDAISWCSQTNSCMSCPPCNPMMSDCGYTGELPAYTEIPDDRKNYITSLNPQNYTGYSFRRIPDGGIWQSTPASPTYATCNDICIDPPINTCNAIAVATATGGMPPYSYQWDDVMLQTTDTAVGLCAGTYHVTIIDANNDTVVGEVTIVDYEPPVQHDSYIQCLNDSMVELSGAPVGGIYSGAFVDDNQVFNFNDSAGVYPFTYTITDENGCSATADFTITVNPNYDIILYDTVCQRTPYHHFGFTLDSTQTANANDTTLFAYLHTNNQCDSNITLHLTILPSEIFTHDTVICEGTDFNAFGFQFSANELTVGVHHEEHIFTNTHGCDSIEILNITINPVSELHVYDELCQGTELYQQYDFYIDLDTIGIGAHDFIHRSSNSYGCDSTFILTLNILPTETTTLFDTICQNTAYNANGFQYTAAQTQTPGDILDSLGLATSYGCDSTVYLNLTILPNPTSTEERTIVENELPYVWNGVTFQSAGTQSATLTAANGCDSIVAMTLIVLPNVSVQLDTTVCETAFPFVWEGVTFNNAGTQQITLQAANGTDSVVVLTVHTWPSLFTTVNDEICQNEPYEGNGFTVDAEGTATVGIVQRSRVLTSEQGCDSTVTLMLRVHPIYDQEFELTVCDSLIWNGQVYRESGRYTQQFTSCHGCDSIVTKEVEVIEQNLDITNLTEDFCEKMSATLVATTTLDNIQWSTGETAPQIEVTHAGTYTVTAHTQQCEMHGRVDIYPCPFNMYLPNAITPSASPGTNDYFFIPDDIADQIETCEFYIYDRWGHLIFQSTDPHFRWDGTSRGKLLANYVFTYKLKVSVIGGGNHQYSGIITVL